ncbi:MAG: response regulator [Pseudomonadota bacterium]
MPAPDDEKLDGSRRTEDPAVLIQEFSSLLTVLQGNTERLRDLSEPSSEIHRLADDTLEAAHRSIALMHRLLTVTRDAAGRPPASTTQDHPGGPPSRPNRPGLKQGARHRILLVEDDDLLRDFVISMLEPLGYRVVAAENGPHALALLDEYRDFDLLFTDVVMPGELDGLQLVHLARKREPDLPVLLTSGYPDRLETGAFPDVHHIHKPYRREDLEVSLQHCLATRDRQGSRPPGGIAR